jgi:deoxyribonuclease-4
MEFGSHVKLHNSQTSAEKLQADVVQVCFGSPRSWGHTVEPRNPHFKLYIHAPYLVNFSAKEKRVFKLSVQTMLDQGAAALGYNVQGIVVHGGSWKGGDLEVALDQWEEATKIYTEHCPEFPPILIENAASGKFSLTRYIEQLETLWPRVKSGNVGFCLDTAHLWASIEQKHEAFLYIRRLQELVGKIQLVHANGSGAEIGAGVDRHSPLATSLAPARWVAWCARLADPEAVITETTDPEADLPVLRKILSELGDYDD